MVIVPTNGQNVSFDVNQGGTTRIIANQVKTVSTANTWQDMVIDVSGMAYISGMSIQCGNWVATGMTGTAVGNYYFDQFYIDGSSASRTEPNLTFATPTSVSKNYGDAAFTNAATSTNSAGAKTYSSGSTGVATVNSTSGQVTIVSAGTSVITATIAANGNFNSGTATYTLTVNKVAPNLTFATPTSVSKNYGDAAFTNAATSTNSAGTITYSSGNTGVATINSTSGQVSIVATGTSVITATIATNGNYNASTATYTLTVNKIAPTLTFASPTSVTKNYGDAVFTNAATSSNSAGAITYTSGSTGVATINSTTGEVTIVANGTSIITASIAANGNYTASTTTYTLTVNKIAPTLTFATPTSVSKNYGDAAFTNAASSSNSAGAITYTSGSTGVATINSTSGQVSIVANGTSIITASIAANGNYTASTTTYTLTVNKIAPALTFATPTSVNMNYGDAVFTNAASSSNSAGAITYTSGSTSVATINSTSGQVSIVANGTSIITASIAANGNYNSGTATYTLTVNAKALTITGAAATNKVYTGTNTAVITGSLSGKVGSDDVTLSGTGTFASVNVANGIVVTSTSTLGGTEAGNYSLTQPTGLTANIYPVVSTFSGTGTTTLSSGSNLTYDPLAGTDLVIASGELVVDQPTTNVHSVTVNAGAQLTLASGKTLNTSTFTLQSDASGTATFEDLGGTLNATTTNVQQHLSNIRNWYLSSPLTDAKTPDNNTYFKYDETGSNSGAVLPATAYWVAVNSGETFEKGRGYIILPSAITSPFTFTTSSGTLNTDDVTVGLTRSGATKTGFNLVGNPYPSHISWTYAKSVEANVLNTIWYRTASYVVDKYVYAFNTYIINSDGSHVSSPGETTGIIAPMQAFWVCLNSGTTGSLTFKNDMRSHQSLNPIKAPAVQTSNQEMLRLQVSNGVNTDEAVVYFNTNASNGYDSYDAPKMTNASASIPEIYTLAGNEHLVINGLNSIPYDTEMPLGFTTGQSNTFTIKASQINNFAPGTQIILKDYMDMYNPVITDLSDGSSYSFTSVATTNNSTRFTLIFRAPSVATGINPTDNGSFWISTNANGQIIVNGNSTSETTLTISNSIGMRLSSKNLTSTTKILDTTLAPGVYLLTVANSGKTITKKFIVH